MAAAALLMVAVITAALLAVNPVFGLDLPVAGVVAAGLALWLLGTSFGAVALLVGAFTGRSATAGGMAGLLALLAWFVTSFSGLLPWLEGAGAVSPFTWYREPDPLIAGFGAGHLWLLMTTIVLLVVAVLVFDRRDIATERAALLDIKVRRRARSRVRQPRAAWLLTDPFRKVIWDRRRSVWAWGGGLGLLSLAMFSAWPALARDAEALAALVTSMPREIFVMFGLTNPEAIVTPAGFISSRSYQSIGPIVVIFFCVRGVSMALVRQEGSGVLDLVLAQPASRSRVVASKLGAVALSAGLVVLIPTVVALLADRWWETDLGFGPILAAGAGLYLLGLFFAGLVLLLWAVKGTSLPAVRIAGIAGASHLPDERLGCPGGWTPTDPVGLAFLLVLRRLPTARQRVRAGLFPVAGWDGRHGVAGSDPLPAAGTPASDRCLRTPLERGLEPGEPLSVVPEVVDHLGPELLDIGPQCLDVGPQPDEHESQKNPDNTYDR